MTTAAETTHPQQKPLERAHASIHQLLRRGIRLAQPANEDDAKQRQEAIKRLEEDARAYHEWKAIEEDAKAQANSLKPGILAAIETLGSVPDSAPKSRRAETVGFVCTRTIGSTMDIDDEAVLELDFLLSASEPRRKLFDQLFVRRVEYTLAPTAHQVMEHGVLPRKLAGRIRDLYALCFSAKTTNPSLVVESKADIAERQRVAAEQAAAKKSTKRAGKAAA